MIAETTFTALMVKVLLARLGLATALR